jgi:hypothetical protein
VDQVKKNFNTNKIYSSHNNSRTPGLNKIKYRFGYEIKKL